MKKTDIKNSDKNKGEVSSYVNRAGLYVNSDAGHSREILEPLIRDTVIKIISQCQLVATEDNISSLTERLVDVFVSELELMDDTDRVKSRVEPG